MSRLYRTLGVFALAVLLAGGGAQAFGEMGLGRPDQAAIALYLPLITTGTPDIKSVISVSSVTLPQPLANSSGNWCTWGYCTISPRLYHEPLSDGRVLVGWTDSGGTGHVSLISQGGAIEQTQDFAGRSVRGLAAPDDSSFAVLLWDAGAKIMWLQKRTLAGAVVWSANIDGPLTSFDDGIGDSRLAFGNNTYAAYFAVYGDSGWVQGHNGDQLTYVRGDGVVQSGGWEWGCSHSMAALVSYHPTLGAFAPVCASDCYASKGVLVNDRQLVYRADGNCAGRASAQLGQLAVGADSWKLVFSALGRPGFEGRGIGLATINGSFQSSAVWLTNTNGEYERDPVIARLGASPAANRYLVGWRTTNNNAFWLGVIDGGGAFQEGPVQVSSAGVSWGHRDDSFRTGADGRVTWVQGDPLSRTLRLYRFDTLAYLP